MQSDERQQSELIRCKGNDLYKTGRLNEAIECYLEAHNLDPKQSSPLANLAAATFEVGDYARSIAYAKEALLLLSDDDTVLASRQRLLVRLLKSTILLKQYHHARELVNNESATALSSNIEWKRLADLVYSRPETAEGTTSFVRASPCKPSIPSTRRIVGISKPTSIFDVGLFAQQQDTYTFLFTRFGDARDFLATLLHIADPAITRPASAKFSFVLTDDNPIILARFLVVLSLLEQAGNGDSSVSNDALFTLFYTYLGVMIPSQLYQILQQHISRITNLLQEGGALPFNCKVVTQRQSLLDILAYWQQQAQQDWQTRKIRDYMVPQMSSIRSAEHDLFPAELKRLSQLFSSTCILQSRHSSSFGVNQFDIKEDKPDTWKTNVTLLSKDRTARKSLIFDPFQFGSYLATKEISADSSLSDVVCPWLYRTARALHTLQNSITIELIECSDPLIQLKTTETFDRIHLSDLPDDLGGSLYVYLFSGPVLRPLGTSFVTWECWKNANRFGSWEGYDMEHLALINSAWPSTKGGLSDVQRLFCMKVDGQVYAESAGSSLFESTSISGYRKARLHSSSTLKYEQLMPREQLAQWLHQILLKIELPYIHEELKGVCFSPYNLNTFIYIIEKLHRIGYPAHWLDDVMMELLSGKLRTSARPPASSPLRLKELQTKQVERNLNLSFCVPELQTLLFEWQNYLGFGMLSALDGHIKQMQVAFELLSGFDVRPSTLVILLQPSTTALQHDQPSLSKARRHQLDSSIMITCFDWNSSTYTATFSLSHNALETLLQNDHQVVLYCSELWSACSKPQSLTELLGRA